MHQLFVTAYCFTGGRMDHWHRNLLKIEDLVFGLQLVGGVYIWRFSPDTIDEKVNPILTDHIALLQSARD